MHLPDGESNPGLLRDRQGYLPLYYRGLAVTVLVKARTTRLAARSRELAAVKFFRLPIYKCGLMAYW